MKAIYPGSFDPLTLGHMDIIRRGSKVFESILVLVAENPNKKDTLDLKTRMDLIKGAIKGIDNVEVKSFNGLTVDYAEKNDFQVILRGIRAASDFEVELEMSQVNNFLSGIETVFLMTSPQNSFIRSSRVWELLRLGANIKNLVPSNVEDYLKEHISGYIQKT